MVRDFCEVWAPAKLNLGLTVLARRPDGYHDLDTTFVAIDLYDHLRFERIDGPARVDLSAGSDPECSAVDFPLDETNLILKALRLIERESGVRLPVRVTVTKVIPSAAGLGGGSSDAAATLWALNALFELGSPVETLQEWGAQIGSDVPFFLNGWAARGTGRGEILEPVSLFREWWAVLLCPRAHASTAEIYAGLSLTELVRNSRFLPSSDDEGFFAALARSHNDLEDVVVRRIPALNSLRDGLRTAKAEHVAVSGSGPTVFGVFRDRPAMNTIEDLRVLSDGLRVFVTRPVRTAQALKTA